MVEKDNETERESIDVSQIPGVVLANSSQPLAEKITYESKHTPCCQYGDLTCS